MTGYCSGTVLLKFNYNGCNIATGTQHKEVVKRVVEMVTGMGVGVGHAWGCDAAKAKYCEL